MAQRLSIRLKYLAYTPAYYLRIIYIIQTLVNFSRPFKYHYLNLVLVVFRNLPEFGNVAPYFLNIALVAVICIILLINTWNFTKRIILINNSNLLSMLLFYPSSLGKRLAFFSIVSYRGWLYLKLKKSRVTFSRWTALFITYNSLAADCPIFNIFTIPKFFLSQLIITN